VSFGQRLEHRDPFSADGQPVGRILDVAAGYDNSILGLQRRADLEVGERGMRVLACLPRGGDQEVWFAGRRLIRCGQ
jgi:hypothetical protein